MSRRIGVISDTHGWFREPVPKLLAGVERILHAGDIGNPEVLERLERIAPVEAVRGNIDTAEWAARLPASRVIEIESLQIYMLHDLSQLDLDPAAAGFQVVISGHSHKAHQERKKGVLYLNPGRAGPRRFHLAPTLALLEVDGSRAEPRILDLE